MRARDFWEAEQHKATQRARREEQPVYVPLTWYFAAAAVVLAVILIASIW